MIDISVGAVGAAIVAGLVSIISLVVGKEQKISEFRQAWIDDLRKCFISYLVNINNFCDQIRLQKPGGGADSSTLLASYKALNEANHGIYFRINPKEAVAKDLLKAMSEFEVMANSNATLTPDNIRHREKDFKKAASKLLKFEWNRVKRGENIYVWTKRSFLLLLLLLFVLLTYLLYTKGYISAIKVAEFAFEKIARITS